MSQKKSESKKEKKPLFSKRGIFIFLSLLGMMFYGFAKAVTPEGSIESYKVLNAYCNLFPQIESSIATCGQGSSTPELLGVLIFGLFAVFNNITIVILTFLLSFLLLKLFSAVMAGDNNRILSNYFVDFSLLCLTFILSMPFMLIPVHLEDGSVKGGLTMYQNFFLNRFADVILKSEEIGEIEYKKEFLNPEIKLLNPNYLRKDFRTFAEDYAQTDFVGDEELNLEVLKKGSLYYSEYSLNGTKYKRTFKANSHLNKRAKEVVVDIEDFEKTFVINYFKALVNHAERMKVNLSKIEVFKEELSGSEIISDAKNYNRPFRNKFLNHCEQIDNPPQKMSQYTMNYYLEVAASCASHDFLSQQYDNKNYDYKNAFVKAPDFEGLNRGNVALFGLSDKNNTMSLEEILSETRSVCNSGGYLACAEAVDFAVKKSFLSRKKAGLLTLIVAQIEDAFGRVVSYSRDILINRGISSDKISSLGFINYDSNSDIETNWVEKIPLKAIQNSYKVNELNMIEKMALNASAVNMIRDPSDAFSLVLGTNPDSPIERFKTCISYPNSSSYGFRCDSIYNELKEASISLWMLGFESYFAGMIVKNSVSLRGGTSEYETGASGVVLDKVKKVAQNAIGFAISVKIMNEIEDNTKEAAYYVDAPTSLAYAAPLLKNSLKNTIGESLMSFGFKMMSVAFSILTVLYLGPLLIIWSAIKKMAEIVLEQILLPLSTSIAIFNAGVEGLAEKFKESNVDIVLFIFFILFFDVYTGIIDPILVYAFSLIGDRITEHSVDFITFASALPSMLIYIVAIAVITWGTIKNISKEAEKVGTSELRN